ncbi:unnamed protein product [Protopolystoma xenopodis]|uniref:Uncharacterized protein n=1 Tax=Protopolystoma xenopodis TaxID=117903 RepID=A0A3S5BUY9_9PLAT|nr:unnamed protein product [Protopolystoma xenopodis]
MGTERNCERIGNRVSFWTKLVEDVQFYETIDFTPPQYRRFSPVVTPGVFTWQRSLVGERVEPEWNPSSRHSGPVYVKVMVNIPRHTR